MSLGFSLDELAAEVAAGYVYERVGPFGLRLYNYAPRAQFDRHWNAVTLACRGLILSEHGEPVARPFRKFFNVEEHESGHAPPLPAGGFTAAEKVDGSLGIIYRSAFGWDVATRGSFSSEQAAIGRAMLSGMDTRWMDPSLTYLAEIVDPFTRVVVKYDRSELRLLGAVVTATGEDVSIDDVGHDWPTGVEFGSPFDSLDEFRQWSAPQRDDANREGWVLRWDCGTRAKVKLPKYVEIHRLLSLLSPRAIWEIMASGSDVDAAIAPLPDEIHAEAVEIRDRVRADFNALADAHREAFRTVDQCADRKAQAAQVMAMRSDGINPSVLFALLDGKDPSDKLWKMVRPEASDTVLGGLGDA